MSQPGGAEVYGGPDYRGRVGFLGGTFNPIHVGHLSIAQQVRDRLGLSKVMLAPNNQSPFKQDSVDAVAPMHRLLMCRLAIKNLRGLELTDREIKRPPPSYTIDSFEAFQTQGIRPVMILGADALAGLPDWHRAAELPSLGDFVYVARPGGPEAESLRPRFEAVFGVEAAARILAARVPIEPVAVSSSEIRERLRGGKNVKPFLRGEVLEYIDKHRLYRKPV